MLLKKYIPLDIDKSTLFADILDDLQNPKDPEDPPITEVILINEVPSADPLDKQKLETLAEQLYEYLFDAICPCPEINVNFNSVRKKSSAKSNHTTNTSEQFICDAKTLVVSIDFDGCADTPAGKERIMDDILDYVSKAPSVEQIVVMIGSLRQTLILDCYNAQRNAPNHGGNLLSCFELGTVFIDQLSKRIAIPVIFDPLMMSDILNSLEMGTTYTAMGEFHQKLNDGRSLLTFITPSSVADIGVDLLAQQRSDDFPDVVPAYEWCDVSKISTMIVQMNHAVITYGAIKNDRKIHFRFYDDREDILSTLVRYLGKCNLVPQDVIFDCKKNNGIGPVVPCCHEPIKGTRLVVTNYRELLIHFSENCYKYENVFNLEASLISIYENFIRKKLVSKLPPVAAFQTMDIVVTKNSECNSNNKKSLGDQVGTLKPASSYHSINTGLEPVMEGPPDGVVIEKAGYAQAINRSSNVDYDEEDEEVAYYNTIGSNLNLFRPFAKKNSSDKMLSTGGGRNPGLN